VLAHAEGIWHGDSDGIFCDGAAGGIFAARACGGRPERGGGGQDAGAFDYGQGPGGFGSDGLQFEPGAGARRAADSSLGGRVSTAF